jgi:hypothetical protein
MQEVTIRLRFNRECLGAARRVKHSGDFEKIIYSMPRDPGGRVMFLPTWWSLIVQYASKVANLGQGLVRKIDWDPIIDGHLYPSWRRIVVTARDDRAGRTRYCSHEAFRPGDIIGVNAVLPDGLSVDDLYELLSVAGTYKGISPFQKDGEVYGTFEVLSVRPTVRSEREKQDADVVEIDARAAKSRRGKRRHARSNKAKRDEDRREPGWDEPTPPAVY